jgi:trehalose transport system substrate-binding protein
VAFVTILAMLAAACGGGDGKRASQAAPPRRTITFSISLAEEERKPVEDLLARFERESGTTVRLVSVAAADLPSKLEVDAGAGRPTIDLFAQDNLALRPLVDKGLVQDLSDVKIPPEVIPSMVPERFGGKQYFLPFRPNVRLAYVNKERFRQAGASVPRTAGELRAAAAKLKASAGTGKVTFSLAQGDPAAVTVSELIVSYGGNPLVLNDPGSVAAFEFLQGMWRDGLLARESLLAKYDTEVDNLTGETAWYAQNWPFTTTQLASQGVLDRFTINEGWRGPARSAHVVGGDVLGVPKGVQGENRKAALEFAAFLISADAQRALVRGNAWPSIRTDAYTDVDPKLKPTFDAIRQALQSGWLRPSVPYWSDVTEQMNMAVERILQKGEPVQPVLDDLHVKIEQAAKRKGSPYPPA